MVSLVTLGASLQAQTPQPAASGNSDQIAFTGSVREVATVQPQSASVAAATLVRSNLAATEAQARLDFSVTLKMHNFAELQERTG